MPSMPPPATGMVQACRLLPLAATLAATLANLALLLVSRGTAADEEKVLTAMGSPAQWANSEEQRVEVFEKLHGSWPPQRVFPGALPAAETEGWKRRMDEYEDIARRADTSLANWELWLDVSQMRMTKNYTASGWAVTQMDPAVHIEVAKRFEETKEDTHDEDVGGGDKGKHTALYLQGRRDMWDFDQHLPGRVRTALEMAIQEAIASWVGLSFQDLQMTSIYGVRVYRNSSVLNAHVDHLETHVLSAVYCVAIEGEEEGQKPWYLGAYPDFTGEDAQIDLRAGQLFLYESAKLPHGRTGSFHGDRYAAMFVHYKPTDWDLTRYDRTYALPGDFRSKHRRRKEGAEL